MGVKGAVRLNFAFLVVYYYTKSCSILDEGFPLAPLPDRSYSRALGFF